MYGVKRVAINMDADTIIKYVNKQIKLKGENLKDYYDTVNSDNILGSLHGIKNAEM